MADRVDLADLHRRVCEAPLADLPSIVGVLVELEERARLRLRAEAAGNGGRPESQPAEVWIKPEAAAEIAGVPKERIYTWAQGQRWAARPTRRCLRIEERGFRRWLTARKA